MMMAPLPVRRRRCSAAEEKDAFDVVLTAAGGNKIAVIKVVREVVAGLGLERSQGPRRWLLRKP